MKKIIKNIVYLLTGVLLVSSCEWEPIKFDSSKSFVAFTTLGTTIPEQGGTMGIVVKVTALLDAPALTVNFEFDTVGIDASKAAFEGTEFTLVNDSKTLSFPEGWGYDTIWITPLDNEIFTGDKRFNITLTSNSENYPFGEAETHIVTLADNEHPLGKWIGTYSVDAQSYGDPDNWDEMWTVTTSPVADDVTKLSILGIGNAGPTAIIATIDKENMTITIEPGQDSDAYGDLGYTESYVYFGNTDLTLDSSVPLVGTISADGSIAIDNFGIQLFYQGTDYGVWDVFDTNWTRTAKKSIQKVSVNAYKAARFK